MDTSNALLQDKEIAIVGGGPGGLMLARLLQLKGVKVKVYERDGGSGSRVQGAIVDLHYDSGLMVMEKAGLTDGFKNAYMPGADRYRLVDKHLNILVDEHSVATEVTFGHPHFRPEIDRGALRKLLLDALLPGTVVWDSHLTGMSRVDGAWQLTFHNDTMARADIVVGADGFRSKVRPYVTDLQARYSGATIIQGEIAQPERDCPEINELIARANLMAMSDSKTIAAQPRGDGGLTFYAAALYPEGWLDTCGIDFDNREAVYTYLATFYQGWHPALLSLFKACDKFIPRPLNCFPPDQQWLSRPDITLIGDAAHLMPPSGEGVNTAMLDALDLSECLTSNRHHDTPSAIAAFEQKMLARAALLAAEALDSIQDFAAPSEASIKKLIELFGQNAGGIR